MRTAKEQQVLDGVDALLKEGAIVSIGSLASASQKGACLSGNTVYVGIDPNEIDEALNILSEAGPLLEKAKEIEAYELAHPDFRRALSARLPKQKERY